MVVPRGRHLPSAIVDAFLLNTAGQQRQHEAKASATFQSGVRPYRWAKRQDRVGLEVERKAGHNVAAKMQRSIDWLAGREFRMEPSRKLELAPNENLKKALAKDEYCMDPFRCFVVPGAHAPVSQRISSAKLRGG